MDIDFFFLLFSACNVLNHFLCAIAQTRGQASRARARRLARRGGAARIRRGGGTRAGRADGACDAAPVPGSFLHNGIHIKDDIIFTFKGPNG